MHLDDFKSMLMYSKFLFLELYCFLSSSNYVINSQLITYVDKTNIYSCLSSKSYTSDKLKLVVALEKYLQSVVNWGKGWLDGLHSYRETFFLVWLPPACLKFQEFNSMHLLRFTSSTDLNWTYYIGSITISALSNLIYLIVRKGFSSEPIFLIYKSNTHPCIECCCNIWPDIPNIYVKILNNIQKKKKSVT